MSDVKLIKFSNGVDAVGGVSNETETMIQFDRPFYIVLDKEVNPGQYQTRMVQMCPFSKNSSVPVSKSQILSMYEPTDQLVEAYQTRIREIEEYIAKQKAEAEKEASDTVILGSN